MSNGRRVEKVDALILHQRVYRESSQLLDVFTREFGVVSICAKGARRKKSPFSSILQPFSPLTISWVGASELKTLTMAESVDHIVYLNGNKIVMGFYLNELLLRLLHPYDPHPLLFDNYQLTLENLAKSSEIEYVLRNFELSLLDEVGFGLNLEIDICENFIEIEKNYVYHLNQGFAEVTSSEIQETIRGSSIIALKKRTFTDALMLREVKILMRKILNFLMGNKPLASRDLFVQMQNLSK